MHDKKTVIETPTILIISTKSEETACRTDKPIKRSLQLQVAQRSCCENAGSQSTFDVFMQCHDAFMHILAQDELPLGLHSILAASTMILNFRIPDPRALCSKSQVPYIPVRSCSSLLGSWMHTFVVVHIKFSLSPLVQFKDPDCLFFF